MQEKTRTVHVRIEGRVQGVGFRYWTRSVAEELNVHGWVRNCADGSVDAVFAADDRVIAEMLKLCRVGPPGADVTSVSIVRERDETFDGFEIRPSVM